MSFEDVDLIRLRTEAHLHGTSPGGLAAFSAANERIDITDLLPEVRVPTLVIHEPAFPFGSFELCQEVAAGIPNAEFVIVKDNSITGRVHDEGVVRSTIPAGRYGDGLTSRASGAPTSLPRPWAPPREVQVLKAGPAGSRTRRSPSELGVAVQLWAAPGQSLHQDRARSGRRHRLGLAHRLGASLD